MDDTKKKKKKEEEVRPDCLSVALLPIQYNIQHTNCVTSLYSHNLLPILVLDWYTSSTLSKNRKYIVLF